MRKINITYYAVVLNFVQCFVVSVLMGGCLVGCATQDYPALPMDSANNPFLGVWRQSMSSMDTTAIDGLRRTIDMEFMDWGNGRRVESVRGNMVVEVKNFNYSFNTEILNVEMQVLVPPARYSYRFNGADTMVLDGELVFVRQVGSIVQ